MITRRVTGSEASHHPKRGRIITRVGRYAAMINSIQTNGFGSNFDWTGTENRIDSWEVYLTAEFELEKRLEHFRDTGFFPTPRSNNLAHNPGR